MLQLLDEGFARLLPAIEVGARPVRPARLVLDPLPALRVPVVGGVHDEMFADGFGHDALDLPAGGVVREGSGGFSDVPVDDHAAFVGDSVERKRPVVHGGFGIRTAVVPAQLVDEQRAQVAGVQVLLDGVSVQVPRHGNVLGCV